MPQRKKVLYAAGKVLFLAFLGWAVVLVRAVRHNDGWDEWSSAEEDWKPQPLEDDDDRGDEPATPARRSPRRRVALSLTFATLFFAGASFTAGAGDMVAKALDPAECAALMAATGEGEDVCVPAESDEATPVETPEAAAEPQPESQPESQPAEEQPAEAAAPAAAESPAYEGDGESAGSPRQSSTQPAADASASADSSPAAPQADSSEQANEPLVLEVDQPAVPDTGPKTRHWVVRRAREASKAKAPTVEHEGGQPTIWLNRALPDPTPPAKRLSPEFAKKLRHISAVNGVSWGLVLAVLRVEGATERVPATVRELSSLARGLRKRGAADSEWNAALALSGRTSFADRVVAVARYNRAVGLGALIRGLEAAKPRLTQELLTDTRVDMYGGGRDDLTHGRVDVRVVVLIKYLAETYGQVRVSSLFSGHRKYARPGVVSAHIYGHAVDVSALGGLPIEGHQEPGGITEKAVRAILLLPVELQPRQVISLLGLGGASFPLPDHNDHIHVGY